MEAGLPGYALQFDAKLRVLLITWGNTLTEEIFLEAYAAVESFTATEGPCCGIADFSAVEILEMSVNFVHYIAQRPPAFPVGQPRIVVAPRSDLFGLSRMVQILRDDMNGELHVVRTLDEAYTLLYINSPRFTTWISSSK